MRCKFEHDGDCCSCGSPQYMCKCKPSICGSAVPMTNADRIRAMSDEELAIEILRRWRAEMEAGNFNDISTRWCDMKGGCVSSKGYPRPCTEERLLACIKRWLQQPVEEDDLLDRFLPICCPEYGSFIAWKKAGGYIVKLEVTEMAKRSSAYGRKCRCSEAKVLAIEHMDGSPADVKEVSSGYDHNFVYHVGEADREGRCVVLPAATVFELTWDAGPECDMICPASIDGEGQCEFCDHGQMFIYKRKCTQELAKQMGKTVFLSREEAEAALREAEE